MSGPSGIGQKQIDQTSITLDTKVQSEPKVGTVEGRTMTPLSQMASAFLTKLSEIVTTIFTALKLSSAAPETLEGHSAKTGAAMQPKTADTKAQWKGSFTELYDDPKLLETVSDDSLKSNTGPDHSLSLIKDLRQSADDFKIVDYDRKLALITNQKLLNLKKKPDTSPEKYEATVRAHYEKIKTDYFIAGTNPHDKDFIPKQLDGSRAQLSEYAKMIDKFLEKKPISPADVQKFNRELLKTFNEKSTIFNELKAHVEANEKDPEKVSEKLIAGENKLTQDRESLDTLIMSSSTNMNKTLRNPKMNEAWNKFSAREFSSENTACSTKLKDIEIACLYQSREEVLDKLQTLIDEHIGSDAPQEVNIDKNLGDRLKQRVELLKKSNDPITLADVLDITAEVKNSLNTNLSDTFSRFHFSLECKNVLETMSKYEVDKMGVQWLSEAKELLDSSA